MASNTISIELSKEKINQLIDFYNIDKVTPNNQYIVFAAKNENCSIAVYTSNKVVFQGKNALYEASIWQNIEDKKWTFNESHAGSDEVGTGDYFGPICVVATYVNEEDIEFLNELGIKDSKMLTDSKIKEIAPKLLNKINYSLLVLDNPKYNEITKKGFNMNKIKAYLHNKALCHLINKTNNKIDKIVIDQFTPEDNYYKYLENETNVIKNITFITKGETHSPAVAAASIIARYSFLERFEQLGKEINIELLKGASDKVDQQALEILNIYGYEKLKYIAKINFKNTDKILEKSQNKLL